MNRVTSKDGTSIAYERQGSGPAVILVTGALDDGSENAPLAAELATWFTHSTTPAAAGASGDTLPNALKREIEDIEALIAEAGGSALVYGVSSGGALALEAAAAGEAIEKLAVYEVPYFISDELSQRWREYVDQLGDGARRGSTGGRAPTVQPAVSSAGISTWHPCPVHKTVEIWALTWEFAVIWPLDLSHLSRDISRPYVT